jgi:hypothetical protein
MGIGDPSNPTSFQIVTESNREMTFGDTPNNPIGRESL